MGARSRSHQNLAQISRIKSSRLSQANKESLAALSEADSELYRGVLMPYKKVLDVLVKSGLIIERTQF